MHEVHFECEPGSAEDRLRDSQAKKSADDIVPMDTSRERL